MFEIGRYPAMNLADANRYWQWFLHRRLALPDEIAGWQEDQGLSADELLNKVYQALVAG